MLAISLFLEYLHPDIFETMFVIGFKLSKNQFDLTARLPVFYSFTKLVVLLETLLRILKTEKILICNKIETSPVKILS
jgi:hypothetical protein